MMTGPTIRVLSGVFPGGAAVATGVAAGWTFWPATPGRRPDANDARQAGPGEAVYRENYASCHGVKFEGQPDERQFRIAKPGALSDDEVRAALAFIKSLWASEILAHQPSPDKGAKQR